jgi:hypothetical protein
MGKKSQSIVGGILVVSLPHSEHNEHNEHSEQA